MFLPATRRHLKVCHGCAAESSRPRSSGSHLESSRSHSESSGSHSESSGRYSESAESHVGILASRFRDSSQELTWSNRVTEATLYPRGASWTVTAPLCTQTSRWGYQLCRCRPSSEPALTRDGDGNGGLQSGRCAAVQLVVRCPQ